MIYSDVFEKTLVPPFLEHVLDPQPYMEKGGGGKKDFLKGQSFFEDTKIDHPPLLQLLRDLANLFKQSPPKRTGNDTKW